VNSAYERVDDGDGDGQFSIKSSSVDWLNTTLRESERPVIVSSHVPLDYHDLEKDDYQRVRNRDRVNQVINESDKVVSVLQYHDHVAGNLPTLNVSWTCRSSDLGDGSQGECPENTSGIPYFGFAAPGTVADGNPDGVEWIDWFKSRFYPGNQTGYFEPTANTDDEQSRLDDLPPLDVMKTGDYSSYTDFTDTVLYYNDSDSSEVVNTVYDDRTMEWNRKIEAGHSAAGKLLVDPEGGRADVKVRDFDLGNFSEYFNISADATGLSGFYLEFPADNKTELLVWPLPSYVPSLVQSHS